MKTFRRFKFGFLNPIVTLLILNCCCLSFGNFPLLDVDTNMRIVLVPHDMPPLIPFYRLKATDSDNNFPLIFEVIGTVGKQLLSIEFLGCSIKESLCQADVKLNKPLDLGRTYEFSLRITDTTGDYTRVKAAITATEGTSYAQFMFGPRILQIPENTPIGTLLDSFIVLKNELNSRTVLLELQEPRGRIELKQKLLSNNRTQGAIYLKKTLDFETESWFTFKLLAMNGYTNITVDTRNVIVSEIIVGIIDVQDSPPQFIATTNKNFIEIPGSIQKSDLLTIVSAVDGDKENKRLIRYGLLVQSNPFVNYFDLDPMSGEIRLKRNISELIEVAKPNEPIRLVVIAEEIIPSGGIQVRKANESMSTTELTFWLPKTSTVSRSSPKFSSNRYVGEILENSPPGSSVKFSIETKIWMASDEIVHLAFENYYGKSDHQQDGFEIIPNETKGNTTFEVRLMNSELDYESINYLKLKLRAMTETGLMSYAGIEIFIRDDNDCKPTFTKKEYYAEINENSPPGTSLIQIQATDCDSGVFGEITYSLIGSSSEGTFHIDPITGEIKLDNPARLDYELEKEIHLHVEAKDDGRETITNSNKETQTKNIATCTVIIKVLDSNDSPPIFESKTYQAILTPELDGLKWPLQIKAIDGDAAGTPNSQIRYQVIGDNRFTIDAVTGELKVRTPLRYGQRRDNLEHQSPYLGSFQIKAYDLGSPKSLSSETKVEIYSEDIISQEIQFVFPTSPEQIRKQRIKIEQMLGSLTGGHVSIIDVSPYENSSPRFQLRARSNNNDLSYEPQRESGERKTVVIASVKSPLNGKSRVFDLEALKAIMTINEYPGPEKPTRSTPPVQPHTELLAAGNQTLFWILIALIIFLLILFFIFLCCLFCPCCFLYRNRSKSDSDTRFESHNVETHTRERISDESNSKGMGNQRRSRKIVPTIETNEYAAYPERVPEFPRGARQAWSGDEREFRSHKGKHPRLQQQQQQRNEFGIVSMDDWEYSSHHHGQQQPGNVSLPVQYIRSDPRADEIGPRWQLMQQQHQAKEQQQQPRPYISHLGDEDRLMNMMYEHGSEPPARKFFFPSGQPPEKPKRLQPQFSVERSPPRSLPPEPPTSEYRNQPRFFKTEAGEVLQFDFDGEGDEGKDMLMRRFIEDQNNEPLQTYIKSQEKELRRQRKLQEVPPIPQQFLQQDKIPKNPKKKKSQLQQQESSELISQAQRPKAAGTTSRRYATENVQIQKEIPEDDEEREVEEDQDENYELDEIPGSRIRHGAHYKDLETEITKEKANAKPHKSRREKDHHHHEPKHTHSDRRRSRSYESDEEKTKRKHVERHSKSKSKSRSKSPIPPESKSISKAEKSVDDEEPKKIKENKRDRKKSLSLSPVVIPQSENVESTGIPIPNENLLGLTQNPTSMGSNKSHKSNRSISEPRESTEEHISTTLKENHSEIYAQTQQSQGLNSLALTDPIGRIVHETQTLEHEILIPGEEDGDDSGIGIVGLAGMRSKMLEKKSVFTIAYDEMATQSVFRPDTAALLNDS